jgi:cytochrome b561
MSMTETRYNATAITLHWLTAGLVISQFLLAELWDYASHAQHHLMVTLHMSLGLTLVVVLLVRIFWRVISPPAHLPLAGGLAETAARSAHFLLYGLLALQLMLGIFLRWSNNHPLSFFGVPIGSPFGTFSKATGALVDQIHDVTAWVIMILVAGHAGVALLHHFLLRDNVLRRMLPFLPKAVR